MSEITTCVTVFVLVICLFDLTHQAEWSYADETQWPGLCTTGKKQSPINIKTEDVVHDYFGDRIKGPLVFRGYSAVDVIAHNNGHTLQWDAVPGSQPPVLSGGPLQGNYTFVQFHLHWLAEHAFDGVKYPLEFHFVHIKTGLSMNEAVERPDGLAVLGVVAEVAVGEKSSMALEEIMPVIPSISSITPVLPELADIIDITRLLSPDRQSYYTYEGSLTTPFCDEAVIWIVMDQPISISDEQYRTITQADVGGLANFRSLQPTPGLVYRPVASCAALVIPGLLSVIGTLVHCSTTAVVQYTKRGLCFIYNAKKKFLGVRFHCS